MVYCCWFGVFWVGRVDWCKGEQNGGREEQPAYIVSKDMGKKVLKELSAGAVFITKQSKIMRLEWHEIDGTSVCSRYIDERYLEPIKSTTEVYLFE
jgi:hypothetical protein